MTMVMAWQPGPAVPSGHVAMATAAAMTAVLVLPVVPVTRRARVAACLGGGFVLVIAVARRGEAVHSSADVVDNRATGLVLTLGAASAITKWSRRAHLRVSPAPRPGRRRARPPARVGRRRPAARAPSAPRPGRASPLSAGLADVAASRALGLVRGDHEGAWRSALPGRRLRPATGSRSSAGATTRWRRTPGRRR